MIVHIEDQTSCSVPLNDRKIKDIISETLTAAQWDSSKDYEVSVLFVSKDEIRKINRVYRKIDRATDVISFSFHEGEGAEFAGYLLGDLVICPEVVKNHSYTYGTTVETETTFVIVHGVLHLLGFDHTKKGEREKMRKMEDNVMKKLINEWTGRVEN